jgi:hypothetical protein
MRVAGGKFWFLLAAALAAVAAVVLYAFPPDQHAWYPRCAFHAVTGLKCPGCGGLRAAHYALHGDFLAALRCNLLVFLLAPILITGLIIFGVCQRKGKPIPTIVAHPAWLWVISAGIIIFGVFRNLPWV